MHHPRAGEARRPFWRSNMGRMAGVPSSGDAPETTPAERREARRTSLVFAKAASFAELEARDLDYWAGLSPGERFQATLELVRDSWYVQGQGGPLPRLDRLAYGVRKLRG